MDSPRAVLATHDRSEALGALDRLATAGIDAELVLAAPGFGENRFDAECGVDPLYPFNVVVPLGDQSRAQELLDGPVDEVAPAVDALPPEVEESGPVKVGYDRGAYLVLRVLLAITLIAHLPRALQTAWRARKAWARWCLAGGTLLLWLGGGAAVATSLGVVPAAGFLFGTGIVVGLIDAGLTRSKGILAWVACEAAAVVVVFALAAVGLVR